MKKLLIALLALTVVGTTAFAADPALKVSGYVNAGAKIVTGDKVTDQYSSHADDWDGTGNTAYVTAEYASETSGFEVTIFATDSQAAALDTGYGWANLGAVPGLKLVGGLGYNGVFDGVDDDSNDYFSSNGLSAQYSVSGLIVGAGMVLSDDPAGAAALPNNEPNGYVFGAAYAVPKLLDVRFNALTDSTDLDKMSVSAKYTGIDKLTLSGGYLAINIAENGTVMDNWADFTAKYVVDEKLYGQIVVYNYFEREFFNVAPRVGYYITPNLLVYGQVKYQSEGKAAAADYEAWKPRAYMSYTFDKVSKFYAQYEYDTEAEKATVLLQYVFKF